MVQVLPAVESFGSQFAKALGSAAAGAAQGYASSQFEKRKIKNFHDLMKQGQPAEKRDIQKEFLEALPMIEQMTGKELTPAHLDQIWGQFQQNAESQPEFGSQLQSGSQSSPDFQSKTKAAIAAGLPKEYIDLLSKEGEQEQKRAELPRTEYIKQEYKSLPKFMESVDASEDKLPIADMSIKLAEEAIEDPGKWAAFRDFLSDKTGYEGFRSAKGAELTSAIKQYFLGDLSSIKGGRPNQLIEQQLLDAYPKIGRDPIANQKILTGMKMQNDIQREKVRVARDLEEKYLAKDGFLPPGFQSIVKKSLRPTVEKIEKDTINKLSKLTKYQKEYEKMATKQLKKGEVLMLSPDGEYEAIEKSKFDEAKTNGYIKLK